MVVNQFPFKSITLLLFLPFIILACDSTNSKYGFNKSEVKSISVTKVYPTSENRIWNLDLVQQKIFLDELAYTKHPEQVAFYKASLYGVDIILNSGKIIRIDANDGAILSPIDNKMYLFRDGFRLKDLLK